MEMQFKNEIKKLADVVVWADNWITELKDGLTGEQLSDTLTGKYVKEFETVKNVVLESMERHTVYTNALNNDIADKAAKIELLEKEIEGRKEGYWALKEKYDKLEKELDDKNVKIERQRKNLDAINKTLEIRNKENDSLVKTIQTTRREIEAHEHENKRLSERIIELKGANIELNEKVNKRDKCIMEKNAIINTAAKMKEDDHGRKGFKRYIEHLIKEEERAVPERFKERLNKEITAIFTKEEETEVNDIPCGEDAIE